MEADGKGDSMKNIAKIIETQYELSYIVPIIGELKDKDAYSWSFEQVVTDGITMLDGQKYVGTPQTAYFKIVATDTAANESVYVYKYSVDPNADRPEINVTSMEKNEGILKYETKLEGTINDDDGIDEKCVLKVYEVFEGTGEDGKTYSQTTPPTTSDAWASYTQTSGLDFNKTSGDWSYTPLSKEDSQKTEMYMQEKERGILSGRVSLEEYFSELKIRLSMGKLDGENLERVFQLSQKTNRFNVTTNRYSREELDSFLDDPNRRFFVFSAEDSFGDYGVIGFVNVQIEDDTGFIADWVMSCRAMSRTIEYAAQEFVERELAESGVSVLNALFIDSGNNAPVRNLFDDFGFELLESGETGKKYTLALPRQKPMKKHYVSICR